MTTPDQAEPVRPANLAVVSDVLSASIRAVVSAHDGRELLNEICRLSVQLGGLDMAWVGLLQPDGLSLSVAARFGIGRDALATSATTLPRSDSDSSGPAWAAIREGRPEVCHDLDIDPGTEPWRSSVRESGFRSMAAIPLLDKAEVIGALSVYATEPGQFGEMAIDRLRQLGKDLAVGLRAIETREQLAASRADVQRRKSELEMLFGAVTEGIVVLDQELRIVDLNPAFAVLVGTDREALLGATPPWPGRQPEEDEAMAMIASAFETGRSQGRVRLPRSEGMHYTADMTVSRLIDVQPPRVVCTIHDLTAVEEAHQDALRAGDYLRAVTRAMVEGMYVIDGRGRVAYANEAAAEMLGWSIDELVGVQAHEAFHGPRPGGGPRPPTEECPLPGCGASDKRLQGLRETFVRQDGALLDVVVSAAPFTADGGDGGTVVVFSDAAQLAEKELHAELELAQLSWVGRVRDAITADRLVLYAQPIVDARTGATVTHELLLRMIAQDGALVPPSAFLPAAERFGLMAEIDRWVVQRAVAVAARGIPVEFNLSAAAFTDTRVIGEFEEAIHRTRADASLIVVELTETALLKGEASARAALAHIRELGCRVAIDDFGTGYGGLTYAKQFPVDILKIDVEFVRDAVRSEESRSVVHAVVAIAADLGLDTVAEGVEDAATLELMQELGVDRLQGYHMGRPVPLDTLG